jgi:hypothetical protein
MILNENHILIYAQNKLSEEFDMEILKIRHFHYLYYQHSISRP